MSIQVQSSGANTFTVTVSSSGETTHSVMLSDDYHQKLAGGVSKEDLIKASFEFLLEREPNTSILRSFDLPLIQNYFPEYETEIKKRIG